MQLNFYVSANGDTGTGTYGPSKPQVMKLIFTVKAALALDLDLAELHELLAESVVVVVGKHFCNVSPHKSSFIKI